jgi:hypothetical protein
MKKKGSAKSAVKSKKTAARPAASSPNQGATATASVISQIATLAKNSPIAKYKWKDRGRAPAGYIKGMALVFARVYCKLLAGDPAAAEMAKADTHDPHHDALSWYAPEFQALGMDNGNAGADTLRHLFVLLIGLGMRESSGTYCEGRDKSASNTTAETAEAGLFQVSYNARSASALLPAMFAAYRGNPSGFVETFKEGAICSAEKLKNWGTGDGKEFQRLSKACPAFAAEFASVLLRNVRKHWGPINTKKAELLRDCDTMLRAVQNVVDTSQGACAILQ